MENIKLVATDMDNTLLTSEGTLPPKFDEILTELKKRQIQFVIASGRPLYTLEELFAAQKNQLSFICDNGGLVKHQEEILFESLIPVEEYQKMISFAEDQTEGVAILCGIDSAYITKKNQDHVDFLTTFYSKITIVEDLHSLSVPADKFTIYFPNKDTKKYFTTLVEPKFKEDYAVTIGGDVWLDLMNKNVDKGQGIQLLGQKLGISSDQMLAFGDTYNDIEMLNAVKYSYIVENADSQMRQHANYVTASNDDFGVIKTLEELIKKHDLK